MSELAAHARLVLACARVAPQPAELATISELAHGPMDWDAALRLGSRHGLAPLMHRHLCNGDLPVPKHVTAALWARAESARRRSRKMLAELAAIATALRGEGVRFAPFKGPLFARCVHGDEGLRESGDLDILVAAQDLRAAKAVLEQLGYAAQTALDSARDELWLQAPGLYELPLVDERRGFMVELQWRANPDVAVPSLDTRWWASAATVELAGIEVRVLDPGEQALALLVHGTKHLWASLDWLVDISELARGGTVPWDEVMRLAREHGATRRAALGLHLARELLGAPLPRAVMDFVTAAGIEEMARRLLPGLLAPGHRRPTIAQAARTELALRDSTRQRAAWLLGLARPTPGDWQWCRLPRPLFFLYWALRPLRLARKYVFSSRSPRTPAAATPRTPPPQPRSTG
jgi:hypothetical protein